MLLRLPMLFRAENELDQVAMTQEAFMTASFQIAFSLVSWLGFGLIVLWFQFTQQGTLTWSWNAIAIILPLQMTCLSFNQEKDRYGYALLLSLWVLAYWHGLVWLWPISWSRYLSEIIDPICGHSHVGSSIEASSLRSLIIVLNYSISKFFVFTGEKV